MCESFPKLTRLLELFVHDNDFGMSRPPPPGSPIGADRLPPLGVPLEIFEVVRFAPSVHHSWPRALHLLSRAKFKRHQIDDPWTLQSPCHAPSARGLSAKARTDPNPIQRPLSPTNCAVNPIPKTPEPHNLRSLRALTLSKCSLEGKDLPDALSKLTNLTELWLQDNRFTELPQSVCKLQNLRCSFPGLHGVFASFFQGGLGSFRLYR